MVASLDEPFLERNGNVHSASIIRASRPDQSRIIAPGMNEDISSRNDVQSTVSEMTSGKRINWTLPFRYLCPINGMRNLCEL